NSKSLRDFESAKPTRVRFSQLSRTRFSKTCARGFAKSLGVGCSTLGICRFLLLRTNVLCRSIESRSHDVGLGGGKINIRSALPTPRAAARFENLRRFVNESTLLIRHELHHRAVFIGNPK